MLIIPAIDIYQNKVVRLKKGDFNQVTYYQFDPFELAAKFSGIGFKRIHIVDLAASKSGIITTLDLLRKIKSSAEVEIQFGGGIRNLEQVERVIESGADKIIIGSLSIENKAEFELIVSRVGASRIIAGIDVMGEEIRISGWTRGSSVTVHKHIEYCSGLGIFHFLCTDIQKDGMLSGPSTALYNKLMSVYPSIKLIASGGISSIEDLTNLKENRLYATVVGRAIYDSKISLEELKALAE